MQLWVCDKNLVAYFFEPLCIWSAVSIATDFPHVIGTNASTENVQRGALHPEMPFNTMRIINDDDNDNDNDNGEGLVWLADWGGGTSIRAGATDEARSPSFARVVETRGVNIDERSPWLLVCERSALATIVVSRRVIMWFSHSVCPQFL